MLRTVPGGMAFISTFDFFFVNRLRFAAWLALLGASANPLKVRRISLFFQKIGDVKECVPLQPDINECRLHSGQNARDTAFVNGTREGVFVFALVVNFRELIVF